MKFEQIETDVLVVGSEGAGARAAIEVDELGVKVLIVTKSLMGKSGVTLTAPYSCNVAFGHEDPRDNPDVHFRDTVVGGKMLSNQELVDVYTKEAPDRIRDLVNYGVKFEMDGDKFRQGLMPGQTYPRAVFFDWCTGLQFRLGLCKEVRRRKIPLLEDFFVTKLLTENGRVVGATGIDLRNGSFKVIKTKATILATGGAMEIYENTDAAREATGDGYALAYDVGAELVDMEFVQFFPLGGLWPQAIRGKPWFTDLRYRFRGAILLNGIAERFMKKYDPEGMEFSKRDIISRAIAMEVREGRGTPHGGAYLSISHLPRNVIDNWVGKHFPSFVFRHWDLPALGIDLYKDAIEVGPVCHYFCGGIRINADCETTIPGLYAAGEVTGGIDGANRLGGNALSITQVHGQRAGAAATRYAKSTALSKINKERAEKEYRRVYSFIEKREGTAINSFKLKNKLTSLNWKYIGVLRDEAGLTSLLSELELVKKDVPKLFVGNEKTFNDAWITSLETMNMVKISEMIARAALMRSETRGAHNRLDHPHRDDENWLKNIVIRQEAGNMVLTPAPVIVTRLPLKEGLKYVTTD